MMWENMPWKPIATENLELGDFDDAVFFGLEELDGNAFVLSKSNTGYSVKVTDAVDLNTHDVSDNELTSSALGETTPSSKKDKKKRKTLKELRQLNSAKSSEDTSEIDANAEQAGTVPSPKIKKSKKEVVEEHVTFIESKDDQVHQHVEEEIIPDRKWGTVTLHGLLTDSLNALGFQNPTPIQSQAIPVTLRGKQDIVGAAETGSGKTLAFCIPVLDYILRLRQSAGIHALDTRRSRCPHALIIAPTRELALQITSVLKEVCNKIRTKQNKIIQVVAVVGGMAEQKQRRLLSAQSAFVDIVVGTPGRLCELAQDDAIVVFQDMSHLRFLIVDEADRIVEDGHFAELNRLFNRICDHEKLRSRGLDPVLENTKKKVGTFEEGFYPKESRSATLKSSSTTSANVNTTDNDIELDNEDIADNDGNEDDTEEENPELMAELAELTLPVFETMPSEEDIAAARKLPPICIDDIQELFEDATYGDALSSKHQTDTAEQHGSTNKRNTSIKKEIQFAKESIKHRQTLLFSATAIQSQTESQTFKGKKKDSNNKKRKRDDNGVELPTHIEQLLSLVGVKAAVHIVDVTGTALGRSKKPVTSGIDGTDEQAATKQFEAELASLGSVTLPKGISQTEIRTPTEDKDVYAYYFLLKHPGRTLLFVNSIKTARRVDGLLRALGFNCRTIHAQLQQRQRLRALESYRESNNSILVATDVAARGLDIPHINSVLHYDVARSPQVYVHRSGRTARAGATGDAVSLVSPEDTQHHAAICTSQNVNAFHLFKVNLMSLPLLRARVKLAKKIFTQSFVITQQSKQQNWLLETARQTDLNMDDHLMEEVGDEDGRVEQSLKSKKQMDRVKLELKSLLDEPVPGLEVEDKVRPNAGGMFSVDRSGGNKKQQQQGSGRGGNVGYHDTNQFRRRGGMVVFAK